MPDVVFERSRSADAAALFDMLPKTRPEEHELRVSIEVQPTPERRGLFRRPVPVPTASVSVVFPDPDPLHPFLLLIVSNFGMEMRGVDPFGYGDALARELGARG